MSVRPHAWTAARVAVAGFCWLTAAYAFVASSTFASLQFLQPRVFPWVGPFSDWHAAASWAWLALVAGVCGTTSAVVTPQPASASCSSVLGGAVVWNTVIPCWPASPVVHAAPLIGVLAFVPTIALALIDHLAAWAVLAARRASSTRPGFARSKDGCWSSRWARPCSRRPSTPDSPRSRSPALSSPISYPRPRDRPCVEPGRSFVDGVRGLPRVAAVGRLARRRFRVQYAALFVALTAAVALAFARLAGTRWACRRGLAVVAAGAWGVSVVGTWAGLRLRREATGDAATGSTLDVFFGLPRPGRPAAATAAHPRDGRPGRRAFGRGASGRLGLRAAEVRRAHGLVHRVRHRAPDDGRARARAGLGHRARRAGAARGPADAARQRGSDAGCSRATRSTTPRSAWRTACCTTSPPRRPSTAS